MYIQKDIQKHSALFKEVAALAPESLREEWMEFIRSEIDKGNKHVAKAAISAMYDLSDKRNTLEEVEAAIRRTLVDYPHSSFYASYALSAVKYFGGMESDIYVPLNHYLIDIGPNLPIRRNYVMNKTVAENQEALKLWELLDERQLPDERKNALLTFGFKHWEKDGLELLPALLQPSMFDFLVWTILDCNTMTEESTYAIVRIISHDIHIAQFLQPSLLLSNPETLRNNGSTLEEAHDIPFDGTTAPMWVAALEDAKQATRELLRR